MLEGFFRTEFAERRAHFFFKIIAASNFEQIICQKTFFSREYDPCNLALETAFLDVGARLDLYQKLLLKRDGWTGYMIHPARKLTIRR